MTEQEWLTSTDPAAMLDWCNSERDYRPSVHPVVTDRQLRLFACACVRQAWSQLTDERSRQAVEEVERFADGKATEDELSRARTLAADARNWYHESPEFYPQWLAHVATCIDTVSIVSVTTRQTELGQLLPASQQAALLRCIIGNPFRSVAIDPAWLTWQDGTIPALAQAAYEERVGRTCEKCEGSGGHWQFHGPDDNYDREDCPDCHGTGTIETGELDAGRLQVLADALEEAGCQDEAILRHLRGYELCPKCLGAGLVNLGLADALCDQCLHTSKRVDSFGEKYIAGCGFIRSRGHHVRGCWVLDKLLENE